MCLTVFISGGLRKGLKVKKSHSNLLLKK
uniref:Uncharacterized protein n=1 Tax=Arundo donax TaxID=35708 RepID=A0A0A9CGF1_ARUDO